jgi:hypothetical protein
MEEFFNLSIASLMLVASSVVRASFKEVISALI